MTTFASRAAFNVLGPDSELSTRLFDQRVSYVFASISLEVVRIWIFVGFSDITCFFIFMRRSEALFLLNRCYCSLFDITYIGVNICSRESSKRGKHNIFL